MNRRTAPTVPLPAVRRADLPWVGGKAAHLGELLAAGLPVPAGFVVTTEAFARFRRAAGGADGIAAEPASAQSERLSAAPMPAEVAAAIAEACRALGENLACAVRSSATAEDRPDASFAGQHDTFLNLRGPDAIVDAVRRCWLSAFSERAIAYRVRHGLDHQRVAMAVIVQQLVRADASGVLFTLDPVSGQTDRLVIEGAYGLGEVVVSGQVTPDRVVVDKATLRVVERLVNDKPVEIVPAAAGGVRRQEVAAGRRDAPSFDDACARRLGEMARQAERFLGTALDLEWAGGDGAVWLLQARPITPLAGASAEPLEVWTNANAVESLPDVVTPMSWSVLDVLFIRGALHPILRRLGLDPERGPWFALRAGRVYMNVGTTVDLWRALPLVGELNLDTTFGGHHGNAGALLAARRGRGQPRWRVGRLARLLWLMLLTAPRVRDRSAAAFIAKLRRQVDEMAALDVRKMSDAELAGLASKILSRLFPRGGSPTLTAAALGAIGPGFASFSAVWHLSRRWLGDVDGSLVNRLISGAGGMASAEAGMDLWRLAAGAREQPSVARVILEKAAFAEVREALGGSPEGEEFLRRWRAFMARHGHHTRGEGDVHIPRWSEMPDYVLDLVRGYLRMDDEASPLQLQAGRLRERQQLLAECRRRLHRPLQRWLFGYLLHKTRRGLAARETVKSEIMRVIALLRAALREAGRRLAQRGRVQDADDVFFLELPEFGPVLAGRAAFDVPATIAQRRADYEQNRRLTPPPVIVGRFDPEDCAPAVAEERTRVLRGLAVSPGVVRGPARVILRADAAERVRPGEILVAPFTDPGWTPYFLSAAGLVVDLGGLLSHGSIVAREYGLPAVVNVGPATQIIRTGQWIQVDGNRGRVTLLNGAAPAAPAGPSR